MTAKDKLAQFTGAGAECMTNRMDNLEEFTPYLINRVIARYNKGVENALKKVGVTVAQMRALAVLAEAGTCTINELSVRTVIKQSTLSRTLDTMEAAGLIRRETGEGDSRIRQISLTPEGRAAFESAWPEMQEMEATMLRVLDAGERQALNRMLQRVLRDIRHHKF